MYAQNLELMDGPVLGIEKANGLLMYLDVLRFYFCCILINVKCTGNCTYMYWDLKFFLSGHPVMKFAMEQTCSEQFFAMHINKCFGILCCVVTLVLCDRANLSLQSRSQCYHICIRHIG